MVMPMFGLQLAEALMCSKSMFGLVVKVFHLRHPKAGEGGLMLHLILFEIRDPF
jgi:hypothetical protein